MHQGGGQFSAGKNDLVGIATAIDDNLAKALKNKERLLEFDKNW